MPLVLFAQSVERVVQRDGLFSMARQAEQQLIPLGKDQTG